MRREIIQSSPLRPEPVVDPLLTENGKCIPLWKLVGETVVLKQYMINSEQFGGWISNILREILSYFNAISGVVRAMMETVPSSRGQF